MPQDDVRKALEAMDDDGFRARYAAGDLTPVPGLDLSEEEQQLVQDAATDYPDVAGFALNAYAEAMGDGSVRPGAAVSHEGIKSHKEWKFGAFDRAAQYAFKW